MATGYIKGNDLWYVTNDGKNYRLCSAIKISEVTCDVVTKEMSIVVKFVNRDGRWQKFPMLSSDLEGACFDKLSAVGYHVPQGDFGKSIVRDFLMTQFADVSTVPTGYSHSSLGYLEINKKRFFFGNEEANGKIPSTYKGNFSLQAKGTYEEWRDFVQEILKENPSLLIPLAAGASASINTRLQQAGITKDSFLWAFIGSTTTGKTTCLSLSASMWGPPASDGLIDNLTGTQKYIFAALAECNGFPFFLDETSVVDWDFTRMVYTIALSREGGRCKPDGTTKGRKTWSGAVVFTGETSLFHRTNGNGGLHARLIEFDNAWFVSNVLPDRINRAVMQYHGTAWKPFINYLETVSDDGLVTLHEETTAEFIKAIEDTYGAATVTRLKLRIAKKVAALLLASDLLVEAWDLTVDRDKVITSLVRAYNHNVERIDKVEEFYQDLLEYFEQNESKILSIKSTFSDQNEVRSSCVGYREERNGAECIYLHGNNFEELLEKYGLEASKGLLCEMEERNILVRFGDRFKKPVGRHKARCYCVNIDREVDVSEEMVKAVTVAKKTLKKSGGSSKEGRQLHAKSLLED